MNSRALELFSGSGSVGRAFKEQGWEVVSLDIDRKCGAMITCDIRKWEYSQYPRGHFDVIFASPCCTQYSVARTHGGPRDLAWADSLVEKTLEIIEYFRPRYWWIENPQTGLLKTRPFMQALPLFFDVDYCQYGFPFRKRTRLWTNAPFEPRPLCNKRTCPFVSNGRHIRTIENCSTQQRSLLPPKLCESIAAVALASA